MASCLTTSPAPTTPRKSAPGCASALPHKRCGLHSLHSECDQTRDVLRKASACHAATLSYLLDKQVAALLFAAAGTVQMVPWAIQKHKRLRKVRILPAWHAGAYVTMSCTCCSLNLHQVFCELQTFDGKDGRPKYPRRWIICPLVL